MPIPAIRDGVALVTGAASGIGRAIAERLAREGARLVLCDIDEPGLARLAGALEAAGSAPLLVRRVDVSRAEEVASLAAEVHARVPALDILVNNAGVAVAGSTLDATLDDWRWLLGVNLWGVIHGVHHFAPAMVARGRGQIVNIASVLGLYAPRNTGVYAASKFAVVGLGESLREELAPRGVGVSTICPGIVDTPIIGRTRLRGPAASEAARQKIMAIYAKRSYPPERVAAAVVGAIRRDVGLRPVAPEAWFLYVAKRVSPRVLGWIYQRLDPAKDLADGS